MLRSVHFWVRAAICALCTGVVVAPLRSQSPVPFPRVELTPAPLVLLPGAVDSNSPLVWDLVDGAPRLFALTSWGGQPQVAAGPSVARLGRPTPVVLEPWPGGGVWMEAVIVDAGGTWYGYFHNEVPSPACPDSARVSPRIGAARSRDHGRTWQQLGIVLDAAPAQADCRTDNTYFDGGVGDFSVQLDTASRDLYFFFSAYPRAGTRQGVGVARLPWADRDAPVGRMSVWRGGRVWSPAVSQVQGDGTLRIVYPTAQPLFPTLEPFHDADPAVDVLWGPAVHWNTHLRLYVMLLNRARDEAFSQEGIYVSFASSLSAPSEWSAPQRIWDGGSLWYPQVVGLERGTGTDKEAGEYARLYTGGRSTTLVHFTK